MPRRQPVQNCRSESKSACFLRTVLGYSYLADWSARRLGASAWWYAGGFPLLRVDTNGPLVACLLMYRLKALEARTGIKTLVVAQYLELFSENERQIAANLLKCAQKADLATLDTRERLLAAYQQGEKPSEYERRYFASAHMSAAGNLLIAQQIANWISSHSFTDGANTRSTAASSAIGPTKPPAATAR